MSGRRSPATTPLHVVAEEVSGPRGVITGIPRSGTSHLCSVLHGLPNHVVINEPRAVFEALTTSEQPWGLPQMYADLRRRILAGKPIENKVRNGVMVEDTAIEDGRSTYRPHVSRRDFVLWTKNTLAYSARIDGIRHVMPDAPIVALVRNPLDTISSWKTTFPHLREADVDAITVGSPHDPFITEQARDRTLRIRECTDPLLRRALLWNHLAETFLEHRASILLVRYEDLVTSPHTVVADILHYLGNDQWTVPLDHLSTGSARTAKRAVLEDEEVAVILSTCGAAAERLGYGSDH